MPWRARAPVALALLAAAANLPIRENAPRLRFATAPSA